MLVVFLVNLVSIDGKSVLHEVESYLTPSQQQSRGRASDRSRSIHTFHHPNGCICLFITYPIAQSSCQNYKSADKSTHWDILYMVIGSKSLSVQVTVGPLDPWNLRTTDQCAHALNWPCSYVSLIDLFTRYFFFLKDEVWFWGKFWLLFVAGRTPA